MRLYIQTYVKGIERNEDIMHYDGISVITLLCAEEVWKLEGFAAGTLMVLDM